MMRGPRALALSTGVLSVLLLSAARDAARASDDSLQPVVRFPPEVVALRAEIEKDLAVLESYVRTLEGYSKDYARTDDLEVLARARENPRRQAMERLAKVPESLNRLDGMCGALQMRTAMVLLDRGLYAKNRYKGEQVKTVAQDYFLNSPEWKTGITDFNELRQIFPQKVNQRLALARTAAEAEEAAFQKASLSHESWKQNRLLALMGGATGALLLAVLAWRRTRAGRA